MHPAVDIHHNRLVRNRLQHAAKTPPSIQGHLQLNKDPFAQETLKVRPGPQDPIETRRRHFQRVMPLDRILSLEHLAHRVTHESAIIDRDTGSGVLSGAIDEYPQYTAAAFPRKLDVDQLIIQRLDRRLSQAHQGITPFFSTPSRTNLLRKQKRGPSAPFIYNEKPLIFRGTAHKARALNAALRF